MNFIYPFLNSGINAQEDLDLSLSLLKKNRKQFEKDQIFVVGDLPLSFKNKHQDVIFSFFIDEKGVYPQKNVILKILYVIQSFNIKDFVMMHDDMFLLKEAEDHIFKQRFFLCKNCLPISVPNSFGIKLNNTVELLKQKGLPYDSNYATHSPFYFFSTDFKKTIEDFDLLMQEEGYVFENLYYNVNKTDEKEISNFRIGFWKKQSQFKDLSSYYVLNYDEKGKRENPWIVLLLNRILKNEI